MVMGGLISETQDRTRPRASRCCRKIPVIGGLFGKQTLKNNRTELVLFITPRVVENEFDIKGVIDDLRRRMERLEELFPGPKEPSEPEPVRTDAPSAGARSPALGTIGGTSPDAGENVAIPTMSSLEIPTSVVDAPTVCRNTATWHLRSGANRR